jgi:hypothetical protein
VSQNNGTADVGEWMYLTIEKSPNIAIAVFVFFAGREVRGVTLNNDQRPRIVVFAPIDQE